MGSYKAYLDQGLDLCPKIYLQDSVPQIQHADHREPPDDVSTQFAYERTASSSTPTRPSQDTRFALTTPSSNRTHASQDIESTPDFSASTSNPTRPSHDTQFARSTPTNNSIHASQGDLTTSSNNRTPSNPRSNPLLSPTPHLTEPQSSQTYRPKPNHRKPSPPPAPPQPPCAKRLWSKCLRVPPPLESKNPRTPGLWTKVLSSSTTPPPASDPPGTELEAPRRHGLFSRRRRSSVPLVEMSPVVELQPRGVERERRQSSPILVSVRTETWPRRTRLQKSHEPLSPHHPDPDSQTTTPFPQRPTRSSSQNDQITTTPFPQRPTRSSSQND
ncbi:hypothetical protein V502_07200 [Pseudogymnoascus sp. VKM F-4520 (FW-2644)]|nr:hypothetical protein V502_07200 [Pseudogymnoascus sp. VKM F-4520 (FW-2644)]